MADAWRRDSCGGNKAIELAPPRDHTPISVAAGIASERHNSAKNPTAQALNLGHFAPLSLRAIKVVNVVKTDASGEPLQNLGEFVVRTAM